jgi:hypothetical protein
MRTIIFKTFKSWTLCAAALSVAGLSFAPVAGSARPRTQASDANNPEHAAEILGVRVGMGVSAALEAVFVNARRKPGEERPDAKRDEGKDVRVLYKKLPQGELQIVFAEGKWVKEIALAYAAKPNFEELHLAPTGSMSGAGTSDRGEGLVMGKAYDDRYQIGYTSDRKLERFWWRDEMKPEGYRVRVGFVSERLTGGGGALSNKTIARKIVSVTPGDEAAFAKASAAR